MLHKKSTLYQRLVCLLGLLVLAGCRPGSQPAEPTSANLIAPVPTASGEPVVPTSLPQSEIETAIARLKSQTPPAADTPAAAEVTSTPSPAASATLVASPEPSLAPTLPEAAGPQLAFLKGKDIWLLDEPGGKPYQLTVAGDILSFAWAPDGQRIAAFNGKTVCFVQRDGSVRSACLDLGLDESLAQIERHIVWSPDQRWIVLWNPFNPWDEAAIGWMIFALDGSGTTYRIQDPVDWGASLAPNNEAGGITGEPAFLADGRLVGTLTHRILCSSGGCHYQLFQFDLEKRTFSAFPNKPEEGWSEGIRLIVSKDGQKLTNYGVFFFSCDSYITFADTFNLADQSRQTFNLEQQALADLSLAPNANQAILARTAGCATQDQNLWSQACGLSQGYDIFPMQLWDLGANKFTDLPAGVMPTWSPDGQAVAFRSCLANNNGSWQPSAATPASIYLWRPADGSVTPVEAGSMPQWRP